MPDQLDERRNTKNAAVVHNSSNQRFETIAISPAIMVALNSQQAYRRGRLS